MDSSVTFICCASMIFENFMSFNHALLFVFMAFCLSACGEGHEDRLGTLVVSTSPDNPPFESFDSVQKKPKGFDMALVALIAEEIKHTLQIELQDFSILIQGLKTGKADCTIAQLSPTPEREKVVDFSIPYLKTFSSLVSLRSFPIETIKELEGGAIGAQLGATFALYAQKIAKETHGVEVLLYNRIPEMVEELKNGRLRALILDEAAGEALVAAYPQFSHKVLKDPQYTQNLVMAFPKRSSKIHLVNQAIQRLEKTGQIAKLQKVWLKQKGVGDVSF